ncbi:hypothetical protein LSH36_158g05017 [Paralvinella palmiformis]|uniref:Guanylate cyclase n=1 Tax=Paralvinella palmiformis TaxID=53620 RepID=A0AAD9JUX4_9ANNE|nr:hypothetical protein LSH36_158g05017 [Paralvinella palmiformis]
MRRLTLCPPLPVCMMYVMLADFYEFEGLLIALRLKGLLDTGEYIVVGVDPKQYDSSDPAEVHRRLNRPSDLQMYCSEVKDEAPFRYAHAEIRTQVEVICGPTHYQLDHRGYFHKDTKGVSYDVAEAFRGFLFVAPASPVYPWFANFTEIVNYYLEAPPFNFTNPFGHIDGILKILRPEAAYLYDAVWIYARAAHEAIREGYLPSDGQAILQYIKGKSYLSAMGYMNHIDENGDSQGNFTLLARKSSPNGYGMYPVGSFLHNHNDTKLPEPQLLEGESIDWIGGKPPIDEPRCGFLGEKCMPVPTYTVHIVGGTIGGIGFFVIIIGIIFYRNWRYEQELASLLWKVDYKDIDIKAHTSQYGPTSIGLSRIPNALRLSMVSLSSQADLDLRQVFTQVGTYKGTIVAIKRVSKKCVDLTRGVRKELKQMRDMHHDNLNSFIGATIDPGNICILTEYCAKGSLQDILANDDVKLDNMFIASLVFDIIKGMTFLHGSELGSHGRLKSSNCVVDSRWVLKITDYGLTQFKDGADSDGELTEHAYYQSLLWTAPELLRNCTPPPGGSSKGDIYSFAIILYEIHGRAGPYGDIDMSPKDIILNIIKKDLDVPFRPKLSALSSIPKVVTDCIEECWQEEPSTRPEFKTIRRMLKPMQKGMKPNIFDNMMAIMEKYANNLEAIVDERTDQLREEKKRTEELLHQMLPRSVADQLKAGKRVEAEAFDSVTIYFSDICGFTSLSSESTPMQVVDFLNDLYTAFDSIVEHYDVYKVETIGDAYMVVSGLPNRNGIHHAGEIASMSLHLLGALKRFKIRHRPSDTLKLRIGINSGPCVAGVVGLKMPRYCLFGDTVNTASRMESNGLPLKIHCSADCKALLDHLGGYQLEERGYISMKGKGEMLTYWLIGEDPAKRIARLKPPIQLTGKRSRMYPHCQNTLQKISSLPILRAEDYSEREPESIETDKLLSPTNGLVARKVNTGEIRSVPCYKRHGATSPRSVSGEKDWSGRPARRSSSVKIKFNDDIIPEHEIPVEQKRRDSLWENFTTRDCPEDVATHSHEVSPLLHPRDSTELDEIRIANGMARSSSADTSI